MIRAPDLTTSAVAAPRRHGAWHSRVKPSGVNFLELITSYRGTDIAAAGVSDL